MKTKPILTYFDFSGGRGEAARLALHLAGVEWTDNRFRGDWPDAKPTTPFGGLPTLEIPGKGTISQSNAILSYIGGQHELLPEDPFECARHVSIMNAIEELRAEAATTSKEDEEEKRLSRESFATGYLATWLANLSEQIRGPFIGGEKISVSDLKLYVAMRAYPKGVYDYIPNTVLDPFPKVIALMSATENDPRVADWLQR